MKLILKTVSTNLGTLGAIFIDGVQICNTMERPWKDNATNISCIQEGTYRLELTNSPKFGETYQVKDVDGRTHILFHKANWVSELQGCIAPCSHFGILRGELAGISSSVAYNKLRAALLDEDHEIVIERTLL